jgi:hypothetical protein
MFILLLCEEVEALSIRMMIECFIVKLKVPDAPKDHISGLQTVIQKKQGIPNLSEHTSVQNA